MNRNFVTFIALILALFLAAGCGSGGSSGTSGNPPSGSGNMQLQVSYPQDRKDSAADRQDLYIQYYLIDLYQESSNPSPSPETSDSGRQAQDPIQTIRLEYPDNTATFSNLEYGSYRIEVGGYDAGNNLKTAGTGFGDVTPENSPSVSISMTPVGSPTPSPTSTISPSPTVSPTESPSPSPSPTVSPSPSPSPTPEPGEIRTQLCSPPRIAEASGRGSLNPTVSNDGKLVVFRGTQQLVSDHIGSYYQIYMFNVDTGTVKLISRDPQGLIGDNNSGNYNSALDRSGIPVHISGNGEFVVFHSDATNLLGSGMDTNGKTDIFLYDIADGVISRISTRFGTPTEGSDGYSIFPTISEDGKYITFASDASNLIIPGIASGTMRNIYRTTMTAKSKGRPITAEKTEMVSTGYSGGGTSQAGGNCYSPYMSRNGRFIVFQSLAGNLVANPTAPSTEYMVYITDMNNTVETRTQMLSVSSTNAVSNGSCERPQVNDDGSRVVFHTGASNLGPTNPGKVDVYMWQRNAGLTLISYLTGGSAGDSYNPSINGDGRYVAFHSSSQGFVQNDTNNSIDCFLYDTQDGIFQMLSVNSDGVQAEQSSGSSYAFLNKEGKVAVFISYAKNLINNWPAPPSSSVSDIFLRQWAK